MTMQPAASKITLTSRQRGFSGTLGTIVLVAAGSTSVVGAWQKWTVNSVAMGAMFAVGIVLLLTSLSGRLPTTLSVTDKGFSVGYSAGSKDTANKAAEKNKIAVSSAAKQASSDDASVHKVVAADNSSSAKSVIMDLTQKLAEKLPTDPEQFLPDEEEAARALANH
jgi:hypothetical protein